MPTEMPHTSFQLPVSMPNQPITLTEDNANAMVGFNEQ